MDPTQLIGLVERNPCLYNPDDPSFEDPDKKKETWLEIAAELHIDVLRVKGMWRRIRKKYGNRRLRDFPESTRLDQLMSFLKEFIDAQDTQKRFVEKPTLATSASNAQIRTQTASTSKAVPIVPTPSVITASYNNPEAASTGGSSTARATKCEKCEVEITARFLTCGGFCSGRFCLRCSGMNSDIQAAVINNRCLRWMCNDCSGIMEKIRFTSANTSVSKIESLQTEIRNNVLTEIRQELQTNRNLIPEQVANIPIRRVQRRTFEPSIQHSAKRLRENEDSALGPPCKQTCDRAESSSIIAFPERRDANLFWLYLSGISPEAPYEKVAKLVKNRLATNDLKIVPLVPRDKDTNSLTFVSFKVGMHHGLKTKALSSTTWDPVGVRFREFVPNSSSRRGIWLSHGKPTGNSNPDHFRIASSAHSSRGIDRVIRSAPCHKATSSVKHLSFYYQNVGGMRTKTNEFRMNLENCDYDIIVLTETWLHPDIVNAELASNYCIFRCDRNSNTSTSQRGGGVLVAVKSTLSCMPLTLTGCSRLEQIAVSIQLPSATVNVCGIYIPPCSPPRIYLSHATAVREICNRSSSTDSIIVAGDYNLPDLSWEFDEDCKSYLPRNASSEAELVLTDLTSCGLQQINSLQNSNGRILDLAFVNESSSTELTDPPSSLLKIDPHHKPFGLRIEIESGL